jgi:antitoxin CptB
MHRPTNPLPSTAQGAPVRLGPAERNRLRWRCRRGLLENDLILTRYLDARGDALSPGDAGALDRLLALPDDRLWEILSGRTDPDDDAVRPLVALLRTL